MWLAKAAVVAAAMLTVLPAARAQVQSAANLPDDSGTAPNALYDTLPNTLPEALAVQDEEPSPKRILGMVPNFQATNDDSAARHTLTVKEKFNIATHNSFDFSAHMGNLVQTSIQQSYNGQPHYGEGWGAFGERFAASEGDQIVGSYLTYGIMPVLFHEDPRYFRRASGSGLSRVWYALSRTMITRRDDGSEGLNKSYIVGQLIANGISTTYYPRQDHTVQGVALNWVVSMGYKGGYNLLSEYYPDLRALLHRSRSS